MKEKDLIMKKIALLLTSVIMAQFAMAQKPNITYQYPVPTFTDIPNNTKLKIVFDKVVQKGTGDIKIWQASGPVLDQTINVTSANVALNNGSTGDTVTVTITPLLYSKYYYITFDSTCFKSSGYNSNGIYDGTWNFFTVAEPVATTTLNESFPSCSGVPGQLPNYWSRQNVIGGGQQWSCTGSNGLNGTPGITMNGRSNPGNNPQNNEDWLFTQRLDLSAMTNAYLRFFMWKRYSGNELKVLVSTDYSIGDPSFANWTDLNMTFSPADTGAWKLFEANITAFKNQKFFVAFKYTSTTAAAYQIRMDSVVVSATPALGIGNVSKANLQFQVLGNVINDNVTVMTDFNESGRYNFSVYDLSGREVYNKSTYIYQGVQRINFSGINLPNGFYTVKLSNENAYGVSKIVVN